jgi:hypothetical protein
MAALTEGGVLDGEAYSLCGHGSLRLAVLHIELVVAALHLLLLLLAQVHWQHLRVLVPAVSQHQIETAQKTVHIQTLRIQFKTFVMILDDLRRSGMEPRSTYFHE